MTAELIEGMELRAVPGTDPALLALTTAQQAELAAMYGEDQPLVALHPDISFTLLLLDGAPVGCVGLQPVSPGLGEEPQRADGERRRLTSTPIRSLSCRF